MKRVRGDGGMGDISFGGKDYYFPVSFIFRFLFLLSFSFSWARKDYQEGVLVSRRLCARRPSRVCLFAEHQQGTLAAHIYGLRMREGGTGVTGGWGRNGGVHTELMYDLT